MKRLITGILMVIFSMVFFGVVAFTDLNFSPDWLNLAVAIFWFVFLGIGMVIGRSGQKALKEQE